MYLYKRNLVKFTLSPATDSVYRAKVPRRYKQPLPWKTSSAMTIPLLLAPVDDTEVIEMPKYLSGIGIVIKAEMFLAVYHKLDDLCVDIYASFAQAPGATIRNLSKANRVEIAAHITRVVIGDADFDPRQTLLTEAADPQEISRILDEIPIGKQVKVVNEYFRLIDSITQLTNSLHTSVYTHMGVFLVKNACNYHYPKNGLIAEFPEVIMGSSTVFERNIRIVHRIENATELSGFLRQIPRVSGKILTYSTFEEMWYSLRTVPTDELIRDSRDASVEAIFINVPIRIKLNVVYATQITSIDIDHVPSTYEQLRATYENFNLNSAEANIMDVNVTVVLKDLGANDEVWGVPEGRIRNQFENLAGSQDIVPLNQVLDKMKPVFKCNGSSRNF